MKSNDIVLFLSLFRSPFKGYRRQKIEESLSILSIIEKCNLRLQMTFQSLSDRRFRDGIRIVLWILNTLSGGSIAKNFESIRVVWIL